ncbi:cell division protein FtsQ/DivIB [Allosaccharopolyspora coralli]|uniref:cell division protein FtsQ/DivIB n=1 Tax=Allosaccharopolyspora coralli TaxID=2665642 RepID=UPI001E3006A9|nr:FtsQ-type POTRA domain-containing protein [Allosaccharopolyspora coralli]
MLTVVTALVLVAYFTPALSVRSVEVQGATTVPKQQLTERAQVPMGRPMLQVDSDAIVQRLRANPSIASADVSLSWPSTVSIEVTERTPKLYSMDQGMARLIDGEGVGFTKVRQPPPDLPELRVRGKERDAAVAASLRILEALPPDVRAEVTAVIANGPNNVSLDLVGNRRVEWGSTADSARKAQILPPLLTRDGTLYDVTTPALPTVA